MPPDGLKYLHRKRVKGRVYLYFDTGKTDPKGKRIFVRLPDYGDQSFFREYAKLKDNREGRAAVSALTVPAFVERFRVSPRFKAKAASTKVTYNIYLAVIEDQFDTFLASDVEPRDVQALLEKMGDRPSAANHCVRVMSALFSWGKLPSVALVDRNPCTGIEMFAEGEHEPWADELLAEGLAVKDDRLRLAIAMLYYTGQRIGDVCKMRWTDIKDGVIYVCQQKTGTELEIPVHRELATELARLPKSLTTILAKPDGGPYAVQTVREWIKDHFAGRGKIVPHGLRKNAVNALLEAGCSTAQVSAITGQSLAVVEHYAKRRNRRRLASAAVLKWEQNK